MTDYSLQPFGQINLLALEEGYQAQIEISGKSIRLDINFAKTSIKKEVMNTIKHFIENISEFNKRNKEHIRNSFNDENVTTVKEYVAFHIEELGDEFLKRLNIDTKSTDKEHQFLEKINLTRVGLYPVGKYEASNFAVFDYTVSEELTDQLIVVNTDDEGNIDYLSWES